MMDPMGPEHAGHCVVCGEAIAEGAEIYSNSWEAVRQVSPCCSEACAERFNPDQHWFPREAPAPMPEGEERRMLQLARGRLGRGELPEAVVRDLLTSGANPHAVRTLCFTAERGARKQNVQDQARDIFVAGPIGLLVGVVLRRLHREPEFVATIETALADLDAWERRFPSTRGTE